MFFNNLEEAQQSNSTGMLDSTRSPVYVDENTGCDCIIFEVLKFKTSFINLLVNDNLENDERHTNVKLSMLYRDLKGATTAKTYSL